MSKPKNTAVRTFLASGRNLMAIVAYNVAFAVVAVVTSGELNKLLDEDAVNWIFTGAVATVFVVAVYASVRVVESLNVAYRHTPLWQLVKWRTATAVAFLLVITFATALCGVEFHENYPLGGQVTNVISMYFATFAIVFPAVAAARFMFPAASQPA